MKPRRRCRGHRPGRGRGRGGRGTSSQAMCGMGIGRGMRGILVESQDQLILNDPWQRKESNALNYFWLYFAIFHLLKCNLSSF